MKTRLFCAALAALAASPALAAVLIDGATPGLYNAGIGVSLDGTGIAFPAANLADGDPSRDFGPGDAPDLSAAAGALGDWLADPAAPGGSWSAPMAIPGSWAVNTETAIIYELTGSYSNVVASFGIDNGIFVWLNGAFLGGHMRPGGAALGEFTLDLGSLSGGTNYLQILREDHGGDTGYAVSVTGDPGAVIPLPATAVLLAGALAGLGLLRRRRV